MEPLQKFTFTCIIFEPHSNRRRGRLLLLSARRASAGRPAVVAPVPHTPAPLGQKPPGPRCAPDTACPPRQAPRVPRGRSVRPRWGTIRACLPPRALDCTGRVNKDTHAGQARPPAPTQGSLSTPTGTGPREGDRDRMNAGVIPGWGSSVRGSEPGRTRRGGKGWWE